MEEETIDDYFEALKTRISLEGFLANHNPAELAMSFEKREDKKEYVQSYEYQLKRFKQSYENLINQPNLDNILEYADSLIFWRETSLIESLCGIALTMASKHPMTYHILASVHHDAANLADNEGRYEEAKKSSRLSGEIAERGLEYIDESTVHLLDDVLDSASFLEYHERFRRKGHMCYRYFSDKYGNIPSVSEEITDRL